MVARYNDFRRFVAIGDSTTEGMDDPDGSGGYRGWADRLAERRIAAVRSMVKQWPQYPNKRS